MPVKDYKKEAAEALASIKAADVQKLAAGKGTSEFKVVVGMAIAAFVNPIMHGLLGVSVPNDVFISLVGLAAGYLGSRTYVKGKLG